MKTADLAGAALDYWVARAEGWEHVNAITLRKVDKVGLAELETLITTSREGDYGGGRAPMFFSPSTSWATGGPIIERDQIFLEPPHDVHRLNYGPDGKPKGCWQSFETWHATVSARTRTWAAGPDDPAHMVGGRVGRGEGETPLIAAMRAKVASHYGDEVPDEVRS